MSAFSLPIPPAVLAELPSQAYGTLRYHLIDPQIDQIHDFGVQLEPRYIFGARTLI
jgi:hypothetical protein